MIRGQKVKVTLTSHQSIAQKCSYFWNALKDQMSNIYLNSKMNFGSSWSNVEGQGHLLNYFLIIAQEWIFKLLEPFAQTVLIV